MDDIITWLLSADVQIPEGAHAGAVVGWSDDTRRSTFTYAEITGYYLTFLAYLSELGYEDGLIIPRIRAAVDWLLSSWKLGATPFTRSYLDGRNEGDWRNRFHFSFDLAMMLRGVISVARFVDVATYYSLRSCLCSRLLDFVDASGLLRASIALSHGPQPHTWSVGPGPHQLKAVIPILQLSGTIPDKLQTAAKEVVHRWRAYVPTAVSVDDLHPFLYFLEGLVLLGMNRKDETLLQQAATVFVSVFEDGRCMRYLVATRRIRSDVVAQILRLGCVLQQLGWVRSPYWFPFLAALAESLASFCGPTGAVYFRRDVCGRLIHANTWSSMFAVQALRLYHSSPRTRMDLATARFFV